MEYPPRTEFFWKISANSVKQLTFESKGLKLGSKSSHYQEGAPSVHLQNPLQLWINGETENIRLRLANGRSFRKPQPCFVCTSHAPG